MKTPADRDRHDVALFRYGQIADIMTLPPGVERAAAVRARAERAHAIPGSTRTRVLRDWIRIYERDGFDGLMPKARSVRAQPRRMSPDVIETLLPIKRDAPELSVRKVIEQARDSGEDGETHASPSTADASARPACWPSSMTPHGSSPMPGSHSPTTRRTFSWCCAGQSPAGVSPQGFTSTTAATSAPGSWR